MLRYFAVDFTKLVMAIFVVGIHCSIFYDISIPIGFFLVDGLFRLAVPFFLLVNGFFFYFSFESGKSVKWILNAFKLYIIWSLLYSLFWIGMYENAFSLTKILSILFFGYYHLWYLTGVAFSALLFFLLVRKTNLSVRIWLITFSFLYFVGVVLQYNQNYGFLQFSMYEKIWLHRNFLFFCLPFFGLGYFMAQYRETLMTFFGRYKIYVLILFSGVLFFTEVFLNYCLNPTVGVDNYFMLFIFCPFMFLMLIRQGRKVCAVDYSTLATRIYLIHVSVIFILNDFIKSSVVVFFLVLGVSVVLAFLLGFFEKKCAVRIS